MSCDPISPYFTQDLNTFEPNRTYKVLVKVKHNDGQSLFMMMILNSYLGVRYGTYVRIYGTLQWL